jgi:plastocyanin
MHGDNMKRLSALLLLAGLAAAPAFASDASVIQKDQAFLQSNVTISVVDTVRWGNTDDVNHNISIHPPSGQDVDMGTSPRRHPCSQVRGAWPLSRVLQDPSTHEDDGHGQIAIICPRL